MKQTSRIILVLLSVVVLLASYFGSTLQTVSAAPLPQNEAQLYLYFFWGDGCPYCAEAEPFLEELEGRYPNLTVIDYEVWYDEGNQELFKEMAAARGIDAQYVPMMFIDNKNWTGFNDTIAEEIEAAVAACSTTACRDAGANIVPGHVSLIGDEDAGGDSVVDTGTASKTLIVPLLGRVNLNGRSLWVSTLLISLVDGFNPCSLWVLSILIALTVRTGSRRKIFIIGITFITVTALVYVLFIAGLFTMLSFTRYLGWIQAGVSVLALFFAIVNIKDYFWYKEGVSFTIDDEKKPGLYKRMRKVLQAGDSLGAMMAATAGLGLGVSLIEFSCTAGFPVLWTNIVAAQNVTPLTFALLLLLYMVIYQIDEFAIFMVAVTTLRVSKLEEKHGRILKLVGGVLMLTLAGVMLVDPSLMDTIKSSLAIFGLAFLATLVVLWLHRKVLPRYGIYIGSEKHLRTKNKKRYAPIDR